MWKIINRFIVIEEWQKDVADWQNDINTWKKHVEADLDEDVRKAIRKVHADWRSWRNTCIWVGLVFGVGGLASVGGLLLHMRNYIKETEQAFDKSVQIKVDDVNRKLQAKLDDSVLINEARTKAVKNFQDEFRRELLKDTFTDVNAALGGVKVLLLKQMTQEHSGHSGPPPLEMNDLTYEIDHLQEMYAERLDKGSVRPERRIALLYVINGIIDRAVGNDDHAAKWFDLARRRDPLFAEAYLYRARMNIQQMGYQGSGKWSKEELKEPTLFLLRNALALNRSNPNSEARKASASISWLLGRFDDAVSRAETELKLAESIDDPRIYYRAGLARWFQSKDRAKTATNTSCRQEAVKWMDRALEQDPSYLKALNNYIWFSSHLNDENDTLINFKRLPTAAKLVFTARVRQLQSEDFARHSCMVLNTLAEGLYLMGDRAEANKVAKQAIDEAEWHNKVDTASESTLEWLKSRQQKAEKGTLPMLP